MYLSYLVGEFVNVPGQAPWGADECESVPEILFRSMFQGAARSIYVSEYFRLKVCVTSSGRCRNKVLHLIVKTLLYHRPSCPCLAIHRRFAIRGGVINSQF